MKEKVINLEGYKNGNVISVMSFDEWENIRDAMNERELRKNQMERKKMAMYFRRQRLFGLCILLISVLIAIIGHISGVEELATIALA